MRKATLLLLSACALIISCKSTEQLSGPVAIRGASSAGARIDKPFAVSVTGADCYSGSGKNAGDVAFGFPNRGPDAALRFTIGPLRDGLSPGQENNKAFAGPGDYPNVGIAGKAPGQKPFVGYGTVTVNADEESGSFRMSDASASGTWNCGHKLQR